MRANKAHAHSNRTTFARRGAWVEGYRRFGGDRVESRRVVWVRDVRW